MEQRTEYPGANGQSLWSWPSAWCCFAAAVIIDLGRALFTYISMRDAAQEGVVYASVYPKPCDRIKQRALQALDDPTGMSVDVTLNHTACEAAGPADSCAGNQIAVTVTNPNFEITMPFLGGVLGTQTLTLKATITGTVLQPRCIP